MPELTFFVHGLPRPGGSKRAFTPKGWKRPIITDVGGAKLKQWRDSVSSVAAEVMAGRAPITGQVYCKYVFYMPRPKHHYRAGNPAKGLKADAPYWHIVDPDATKLVRSTEDAMNGLVWRDDCQVCQKAEAKLYGEVIGAQITVTWFEEGEKAGELSEDMLALIEE